MKRSREFIFDRGSEASVNVPSFCSFDLFDHDLILFCDSGFGYRFKYEDLTLVGGRSALPFESDRLCDLLELPEEERCFFIDFLDDGDRKFCLLTSQDKVVLVFNRLFRSCGLGVAAILNYSPECAASAIRHGLLDRLGERIYSPRLIEATRGLMLDSDGYMDLVYSILKIADALSAVLGESNDAERLSARIRAVSAVVGCGAIHTDVKGSDTDEKLDADSLAAMILCLFSLCRRLSVDRGGEILIDGERERVKLSFGFGVADVKPSASDLECVGFCERLALKLEMPLSIELSDGRFYSELVPFRVDPSLYGLKAGVHIVIKGES